MSANQLISVDRRTRMTNIERRNGFPNDRCDNLEYTRTIQTVGSLDGYVTGFVEFDIFESKMGCTNCNR